MPGEPPDGEPRWSKLDLCAGVAIASIMLASFTIFSSGASLRVTFVPGVVIAGGVWVVLVRRRWTPSKRDRLLVPYFGAIALQVLHFAEEFITGFHERFPALYGAAPYPATTFVTFNMAAYAVFIVAGLVTFAAGRRTLLIPVLFFIVYGMVGNAVSHVTWSIATGGYFPGLVHVAGLLGARTDHARSAARLGACRRDRHRDDDRHARGHGGRRHAVRHETHADRRSGAVADRFDRDRSLRRAYARDPGGKRPHP